MEEIIRKFTVIDENGEIIDGKFVQLEHGDKVLRKASREYLKRKSASKRDKAIEKIKDDQKDGKVYADSVQDVYTKAGSKEFRYLLGELNVYEKAFLLSVMPYVGYEDCAIKKDNGSPLNIKDFALVSGMSESKVYDVIAHLKKECIIYKGKTGSEVQYFVCPWLFCRGNRFNKVLKYMFREYKVRCRGNVAWKDLK